MKAYDASYNMGPGKFIETMCICDGYIRHQEWHQRRMNTTLQHFYPGHDHSWDLNKCIDPLHCITDNITRCRIIYDAHYISVEYDLFQSRSVNSLQSVDVNLNFNYSYKFAAREMLHTLFNQRGDADDILIIKNGWVTDTSIANIALHTNGRWYTPLVPLLAGTSWKRLVTEGILYPRPINQMDLKKFDTFKVFNALIDFESTTEIPVCNIR